jgi:hypothetical protein
MPGLMSSLPSPEQFNVTTEDPSTFGARHLFSKNRLKLYQIDEILLFQILMLV